jgi:hypothetical protein
MAIAAVQRVGKGANATSVSIGPGDGWATPTAGNLLVFSANSDATVTLSGAGTVTNTPSIIDGNGAYAWYKFATGSETTITGTPSTSDDIVLTCQEYSGVGAFDAANSSTIAGSAGTTTTAASVTTTAAGDLLIGFALTHLVLTSNPTGPAWTNSLTNVLNTASPGGTTTRCVSMVGELTAAGAAGSYSSVCTWTNQMNDRQHIFLAFTAAAGGAAPAFVPAPSARRRVQPPRRRPQAGSAVRAQTDPPFPFTGIKQPRRLRGVPARRGEMFTPVPPQVVVAAPVFPPRPVRARLKGLRLYRGEMFAPPSDQLSSARQTQRPRLRLPRIFRGHAATPVPAQVVVTAPAYPVQSVRTRLRGLRIFRGRAATVVPPQIVVTPPSFTPLAVRTRLRFVRLFRGRTVAPVPDQLAAPPAPHLRPRGMAPRRGHAAMPVPPQTVIAPPAYPVRPVRSRLKGLRSARGRQAAMPVPPQVVIVPPKMAPLFARLKQHAARIFRGESRAVLPPACDCTTHRPNLGTTARPSSGMTSRPDSGTTSRPCSCND